MAQVTSEMGDRLSYPTAKKAAGDRPEKRSTEIDKAGGKRSNFALKPFRDVGASFIKDD